MKTFMEQLTTGTVVKLANKELGIYVDNGYKDRYIHILDFSTPPEIELIDINDYCSDLKNKRCRHLDIVEVSDGILGFVFLINEIMSSDDLNSLDLTNIEVLRNY